MKVSFSGIMHEENGPCHSFLFLFMPHTFPLSEQASLTQNGMYCCICAAHDKCQQLDCVFLKGLPEQEEELI